MTTTWSSLARGALAPWSSGLVAAAVAMTAACGAVEPRASAQDSCGSDEDCKGDRICNEDGHCVDPDSDGASSTTGSGASGSGGSAATVHPCGAPGEGSGAGSSAGADTEPPVVSCIGFDKTAYGAGEVGHLEYRATDAVSGITDFEGSCWAIESASGASDISVCDLVEHLGGDLYRIPFEVGDFVETGDFFLARAYIHDNADNHFDLSAEHGDQTYEGTSIPVARTTIGGSTTDTTPPVVTGIGFDKAAYAPGEVGWIQYQASDALSGIADFEGSCWAIESASGASSFYACGGVEAVGGGVYRLPFEMDAFVEPGAYFLRSAIIHDKADNGFTLSASYDDSVYSDTSIPVARTTIE